jgi:hypothetical protein
MKLLTVGNPKLVKGQKQGYLSFVLHLAPATLSGYNVCPMASAGCAAACLNTAGRGGIMKKGETTNNIQQARIRRTVMFFEQRDAFMATLVNDIKLGIKQAQKLNLIPVFRLNGTSDIRWETVEATVGGITYNNVMGLFPTVQFYDYTKLNNRRNLPANYHLTFSRSESNDADVNMVINGIEGIRTSSDINIAVVFDKLPATFLGRPVINGDETDLRFLDPRRVIVGLKAKGKAKKDNSGFTILTKGN